MSKLNFDFLDAVDTYLIPALHETTMEYLDDKTYVQVVQFAANRLKLLYHEGADSNDILADLINILGDDDTNYEDLPGLAEKLRKGYCVLQATLRKIAVPRNVDEYNTSNMAWNEAAAMAKCALEKLGLDE